MARMVMDHAAATAIGTDHGNRQMRKAGRTRWSRDDFNAAAIKTATMAYNGGLIGAKQFEELTGMTVDAAIAGAAQ